jgi:signal transduction histidine kinase
VEEIYLALRAKSGDEMPVLVNAVQRERAGVVVNDCVVVRMHRRRQYEDELLQAQKAAEAASQAKAKFLSMMSHDLRTPLQAISGFADLLSREKQGSLTERQRKALSRIQSASREMMRLINDLLDFAQLETGRVEVQVATVLVETALRRAESLVMLRLQEAGLDYRREGCWSGAAMWADPDRLQQILLNLLTNAIKFTNRGGRVSITCERRDDQTLIQVRDTGCGIPADQLQRIFEPFVQLERQQLESSQRGVGLGLAISRELAQAMGGDLTVESVVGQGSVFTLRLPTAESYEATSSVG